ncbi:MAG: hypothetical protein WC581_10430 [Thermodesulfovibrionales bacterium]
MRNKSVPLILCVWLVLWGIFSAASARADVFINDFPEDITVYAGQPLDIPIFFLGGTNSGKPIELFVWIEGLQSGSKAYYSFSGWVPFTDLANLGPLLSVDSMVEYVNIVWPMLNSTSEVESFKLSICMDSKVDGLFTLDTSTCGERVVNIVTPPQNCEGFTVAPASISESLQKGGSKTVQLSVKDSCNQPISFSATASQGWITLTNQQGISNATLNAASLSTGSYPGVITFTSGSSSKTVNVALTVTAPGFNFGGGGCTPSSISVWPINITAESGVKKTATTSVANNCGTAVSYIASVTSGSPWLTVTTSGTGTVTVTVDAAGKASGNYSGTINISAGGLTSATLNVTLNVTGPCTPSTVEVNPLSISSTVFKGSNASDVSVTVKDNCGKDLAYTITAVSAAWTVGGITAPVPGTGTGSFVAKFHTDDLAAGTYNGSIALNAALGTAEISKSIQVSVRVTETTGSTTASRIQNGKKYFFGIAPGEVKYFYFTENSDKGTGNTNELMVDLADMTQSSQYNVDMVIRYSGPTCDDSKKPTIADRTNLLSGQMHSGGPEGFYANMSGTAMETNFIKRNASINPDAGPKGNPEGCYYVMVVNVDVGNETQLRIGYSDYDSNIVW